MESVVSKIQSQVMCSFYVIGGDGENMLLSLLTAVNIPTFSRLLDLQKRPKFPQDLIHTLWLACVLPK